MKQRPQRGFILNPFRYGTAAPLTPPTVATRSVALYTTSANQSPTMPSGIVAGNLLLDFFAVAITSTITGWSKEWVKLHETVNAANTFRMAIFAKIATGSDALTVNLGTSSLAAHGLLRISGSIGSLAINIAAATAASTLDPPPVTPAHGADSYLAIAALGWIGATNVSGYPSGYSNGTATLTPSAGKTGIAVANNSLAAGTTTEDPATFAGAMAAADSIAATVLVYAGMPASPFIAARTWQVGGTGTSQAPSMPFGLAAGNLLLELMTCPAATTISGFTAGWTKIQDTTGGSTRMAIFAKIAAGGDGLTINVSPGSYCTFAGLRLSGTIGSVANVESSVVAGLDPPSLTPAHGPDSYTAIAALGWVGTTAITAYPSGYPPYGMTPGAPAAAGRPGIGFADRYLSATTEDPGAFTGGMADGIAATILVYTG